MIKHPAPNDPQSAFCEVCLKLVPKSGALMSEGKDYVAYFCSAGCYESWQGKRAPAAGARRPGRPRAQHRARRAHEAGREAASAARQAARGQHRREGSGSTARLARSSSSRSSASRPR